MATITLRVEDQVRDQLQDLADGRGISLSDLLREQIDELFDRNDRAGEGPRRRIVPESMSPVDRRQLELLHRILARLVEEKTEDERLEHDGDTAYQLDRAEALAEGWAKEYDMEFYSTQPELTRRDCGLVMDLLDMFRMLKLSIEDSKGGLSDETVHRLTFHGFDLNDDYESRLLAYARFLVSDDRWTEQAEVFSSAHDRGNSHAPLLGAYRRMLEAYEPLWRNSARKGLHRRLSTKDLEEIAAAAVHPNRRRQTD